MFNLFDFISNEEPTAVNIITLFGCVASVAIVGIIAFIFMLIYAPKLIFALIGLFFVGCWYRMYKLGYLTPRKNSKDQ